MSQTFNARDYPILYVDDEEANLIVFSAAFEDDFDIRCASSGAEGLEILNQEVIHVVISDFRMPGMNGVEFLETVRLEYPDATRMMATAYAEPQTAIAAINRAGVHHFIQKPFDDTATRNLLKTALQRSQMDHLVQRLHTSLIERERLAGVAAAQRQFIHDLANVNTIVSTCCTILQDLVDERDDLDPLFHEVMTDLQTVVTYFGDLHNKSHSILSPGHIELHPVDDIIEAALRLVARKGLTRIHFAHHRSGLSIFADRIDIGRILVNLMTNAVQAMVDAKVAVPQITLRSDLVAENQVQISVHDNGPGIPEDLRAAVFEDGFTTRAKLGGTGLGLRICSELVQANGGHLALAESDEGACFHIVVPTIPSKSS